MISQGQAQFNLSYVLGPIILVNGIATGMADGMLPLINILPNAEFAKFWPLLGGLLINNEIGKYPFANQSVAGNAIIANPLTLSVMMETPANQEGGYSGKLAAFTSLQASLSMHGQLGGVYTIATPAFTYNSGILLQFRDTSRSETKQVQNRWQLDFEFPLLTLQQAQQALGNLMSKLNGGLPVTSTGWSGLNTAVGTTNTTSPVS